jgi:hypothetical protein
MRGELDYKNVAVSCLIVGLVVGLLDRKSVV